MIPRTKVNYTFISLMAALFTSEKDEYSRQKVIHHLECLLHSPHILLTGSGRGALYLLLLALPHRKVFIPAYTCKAVAEAALLAGKEIFFGESEPDGFNMDPDKISEAWIDEDTVLVLTHQFGLPCQFEPLLKLARQVGAFVVEDAAASLGSRSKGRLTGTLGDAAFFSFDSTKLLNVPLKGGCLWVRDPDLFAHCWEVYEQKTLPMPLSRKLYYLFLGFALVLLENPLFYRVFHNVKFQWRGRFTEDSAIFLPRLGYFHIDRFSEWQAVILLPQLDRLEQIIAVRRQLYDEYLIRLAGAQSFLLPPKDIHQEWAPIRFPIRVFGNKLKFYEEAVRRGVDFAFSFTFLATPSSFLNAHKTANMVLDLPFYEKLTNKEIDKIVSVVMNIDKNHNGE